MDEAELEEADMSMREASGPIAYAIRDDGARLALNADEYIELSADWKNRVTSIEFASSTKGSVLASTGSGSSAAIIPQLGSGGVVNLASDYRVGQCLEAFCDCQPVDGLSCNNPKNIANQIDALTAFPTE